ncbi:HTH-type transcriptional regulator PgrR [Escherichia coli]|nr:HTH-type transcriptional regulator PgrR [Escherichia coli]
MALKSFTKAAAEIGVTPSAISHTVKSLEERLGIRLLARTTRSISTTEAGERLINEVGPLMEQVDDAISRLSELREKPTGVIRLTAADDVIQYLIRPVLPDFLSRYPDIQIEIGIDYGFTDIVDQRFDAGIRPGDVLNNDMIAAKISQNWRQLVVAAPDYFKRYAKPRKPQDLLNHNCINVRYSDTSGLYAGIRERCSEIQSESQREIYCEQHDSSARCSIRRAGDCLYSRVCCRWIYQKRQADCCSDRVVSIF